MLNPRHLSSKVFFQSVYFELFWNQCWLGAATCLSKEGGTFFNLSEPAQQFVSSSFQAQTVHFLPWGLLTEASSVLTIMSWLSIQHATFHPLSHEGKDKLQDKDKYKSPPHNTRINATFPFLYSTVLKIRPVTIFKICTFQQFLRIRSVLTKSDKIWLNICLYLVQTMKKTMIDYMCHYMYHMS